MRRFALAATAALLSACQPQVANNAVTADPADAPLVPAPVTNTVITPGADPAATPAVETPQPVPTKTPASLPAVPPKAAADYRSDLRLTGTEPFWGVQITAKQIKLERPDHPAVTVANTGPEINGEVASWNTRELKITLKPATCSDGMSDNVYPYEATVRVGTEVLKGCAARADGWPRRPN